MRQSFWPWIGKYEASGACKHVYARVGRGAVAVLDVESNEALHRILNEWADIIPAQLRHLSAGRLGRYQAYAGRPGGGAQIAGATRGAANRVGAEMKDLAGRLAVVTGGGTGMGRELVRQLVAEGCNVAMCDVSAKAMAETRQALRERWLAARRRASPRMSPTSPTKTQVLRFRDEVAARARAPTRCICSSTMPASAAAAACSPTAARSGRGRSTSAGAASISARARSCRCW